MTARDTGAEDIAGRGLFLRGLRVIWSYVLTHPGPFSISVVGATVYAALTVASAVVLGGVTDDIIYPAFKRSLPASTLWAGVAAVVGAALLRSASIIVRRYFAGMTAYRMQATLKSQAIDRYRECAYVASIPPATEVLNPVPFSIAVVFLVLFATVSLVTTDLFLALIGLLLLPALAALNRIYGHLVEGAATRAQQRIGDVSAVAHESIDGALVVGRARCETGAGA
ncbi:MAG: ABC transporter transmembrane domain-containing protein [Actinomycetota bacterium]